MDVPSIWKHLLEKWTVNGHHGYMLTDTSIENYQMLLRALHTLASIIKRRTNWRSTYEAKRRKRSRYIDIWLVGFVVPLIILCFNRMFLCYVLFIFHFSFFLYENVCLCACECACASYRMKPIDHGNDRRQKYKINRFVCINFYWT